jgi:hypothetical protein
MLKSPDILEIDEENQKKKGIKHFVRLRYS